MKEERGREEGVAETGEKKEEEGRKISDTDPRYKEVSRLPWQSSS